MLNSISSQFNNLLFFRRLFSLRHLFAGLTGMPLTVNFLITDRCNLDCGFCTAKSMINKQSDLPKEAIIGFLGRIARLQPAVFFGGGEPFLREDIFDILEAVKRNRLKSGIVTNGTLLKEENVKRLFKVEPEVVIFSLHDDRFEIDKAFSLLSKAVGLAVKNRKKAALFLNAVITRKNHRDLEQIILKAKQLGVDKVRFENLIFLTSDEYKRHIDSCRGFLKEPEAEMTTYISEIDSRETGSFLMSEVPRLKKKYGSFAGFKPYLTDAERKDWFTDGFCIDRVCTFVKHSLFIKPNGDMIPCQFFTEYVLGNIRTDDLSEVWKSKRRKDFVDKLSKKILPGCKRCCKL